MGRFIRYAHIWLMLTKNAFLTSLTTRFSAALFFCSKALRFAMMAVFLSSLVAKTGPIRGYDADRMLLFFLTFNLIDTVTQLLFREVYRFRSLVVTGDFDLVLVKPMHPLFRALAGGADPIDLIMLGPYVIMVGVVMSRLGIANPWSVTAYGLLVANGILIAAGFHILVLSATIVTSEIDHTIMIYRDLSGMGRVPVDIYREPVRSVITFFVPVGIMMTFPAKAFLGLLSPAAYATSILVGIGFVILSLRVWRSAVMRYASASS